MIATIRGAIGPKADLLFGTHGQFTTGGAENPTLTIVALAIRQADHIAGAMAQGSL